MKSLAREGDRDAAGRLGTSSRPGGWPPTAPPSAAAPVSPEAARTGDEVMLGTVGGTTDSGRAAAPPSIKP
jgi:hypothetical protein